MTRKKYNKKLILICIIFILALFYLDDAAAICWTCKYPPSNKTTDFCGDGKVSGSEECDQPGNMGACPKDCSSTCRLNNCGSCELPRSPYFSDSAGDLNKYASYLEADTCYKETNKVDSDCIDTYPTKNSLGLWRGRGGNTWYGATKWNCNTDNNCFGCKMFKGYEPKGEKALSNILSCERRYSCSLAVSSKPSVSNVHVAEPNYSQFGPGGTTSWTYSDPQSSSQNGYRIQIINQSSGTTVHDSCSLGSGCGGGTSTTYSIPLGILNFNTTYYSRVMVWNSIGLFSPWANMTSCTGPGCFGGTSWTSPPHHYPQVSFTYSPNLIMAKKPVQFTNTTTYGDDGSGSTWLWDFSDPPTSTLKNPTHTFNNLGTYTVTLTATDNDGHTSTRVFQVSVSLKKPFPRWREILPF